MIRRSLFLALVLLLAAPTGASGAPAPHRVALVIGNGKYAEGAALKNPGNDAADLASALRKIGFEVILGRDLGRQGMRDIITRDFKDKLDPDYISLFFYAGHGVQVDGRNYLVPVDARLKDDRKLPDETIDLQLVLDTMEASSLASIVILDACRDNPFVAKLSRSLKKTRSGSSAVGRGLADIRSGESTLIVYSTDPGGVAQDGDGRNSPFAEALLRHLPTPGVEMVPLMKRVRQDVDRETNHKQKPWTSDGTLVDVFLVPPAGGRLEPAPAPPQRGPPAPVPPDTSAARSSGSTPFEPRSVTPADFPFGTSSTALCDDHGYCVMKAATTLYVNGKPKGLVWVDQHPPYGNRWYANLSHPNLGGNVVAGADGLVHWSAQMTINKNRATNGLTTAEIAVGGPSAVSNNRWVYGAEGTVGDWVACTFHDHVPFGNNCTGCDQNTSFAPVPMGSHLWEYRFDFNAGTWDFYLDNVAQRTGCAIPVAMKRSRTLAFFGDQGDNTNGIDAMMSSWSIRHP